DHLLPPKDPLRESLTRQMQRCEQWPILDKKVPAFLRGTEKPGDTAELLSLAELCVHWHRRYATAAHFYADAFSAQPKLADDLKFWDRYSAACAAGLAAGGHGQDANELDGKERDRLRQQALTWLKADLAAWAGRLDKATLKERNELVRTLRHWQQDNDLA